MKRSIASLALAGLFVTTPLVSARDDDDYRRGRGGYGNSRSRDGGWYGDGQRDGSAIIDRTLSNLRRAASRNRVDGHERDHFRRAMSELQTLRYRSADGRLDEGRLNRAIEDLEHLSNARQINPNDRRMLSQDMYALQNLRYSRDSYYRR
jgi:hypothetical protein